MSITAIIRDDTVLTGMRVQFLSASNKKLPNMNPAVFPMIILNQNVLNDEQD